MSNQDDRWLWFIDDAPLQALLKAEGELGTMKMRAASSPALVRAVSAHLEGRTAEGVRELNEAIAGGERQPEIYLLLGQLHFEARQFEEAAEVYEQLHKIDPANTAASFNLGVALEKLSKWAGAAAAFGRAGAAEDGPNESWFGLGLCQLHQRRPEAALEAFEKGLKADANNESGLFGKAVALQMLRRFDEAQAIYDRCAGGGEPSPELLINLLALAVARKDIAAVRSLAARIEKSRLGARQTAEALAYVETQSEEWARAGDHLQRLAGEAPLPDDWAYGLAYCQWRSGRLKAAGETLEALLGRSANHGAGLLLQAAMREEAGDTTSAMLLSRQAARNLRDAAPAWWNVTRLAAAEGDAKTCAEAARSLAGIDSGSAQSEFARGLAALQTGSFRSAADAFGTVLRLQPDWVEAEWNLGLSHLLDGNGAQAATYLSSAAPKLPAAPPSEPLAAAALAAGDAVKCRSLINQAPEGETIAPELLYNLALAFHDQGRMQDAEPLYLRAIEARPSFTEAHINLGHVLLATGRPAEAEARWRQA